MSKEIELKYELEDVNAYVERLCQLGVSLSSPITQHDTIFFRTGKCFKDLRDGEPVIRIRQANNNTKTTIKKYISGISEREEVECGIADAEAFKNYLALMDYFPVVAVKKTRQKGTYCGTTITIDYVEGLGEYTEIEIVTHDESTPALEIIKRVAEKLGLGEKHIVSTPYDEMLFLKGDHND